MRIHELLVGVLLLVAGCGKVAANQPDASGGGGDSGSGGCTTSAECTDPSKPFCTDSACVAACHVDDDCASANAKPYCASDGACVGCKTNAECSANAPVCDATARACRGCAKDSECASGVCLEAEGTCADTTNVLFVRAGGTDTGATCPMATPCGTLPYALSKVTSQRNVIHILGATFSTNQATVTFNNNAVTVDGSDTTVTRGDIGPIFTLPVNGAPTVVLSGLKIAGATDDASVSVAGGTMQLYGVTLNAPATLSAGTLDISHSVLADKGTVTCSANGKLNLTDSLLHDTVYTTNCTLKMQRNHHDSVSKVTLQASSTMLTVENNTIVNSDYFTDPMSVDGPAGSVVRFNTFVNVSGVDMTATVLSCSQTVTATSNIFAWHSSTQPQCATKYSLYDQLAGTPAGTGNRSADVATFFVDLTNKDLHLAASSPAKGMAEAGLVTVDADGHSRPLPVGSNPDIGAYEAP